jgi:hypothetical protein
VQSAGMGGAVERIETFCGRDATGYAKWLSVAKSWPNAAALHRSIALAASREYLLDHLAALRYALIFSNLGFAVEFEPTGSKGPDLLVRRDGLSTTIEVTRFRHMHSGSPKVGIGELQSDDFRLEPYGDPARDIIKCLEKVRGKFHQASGPSAVIAVWNSDDDLEELEMASALADLQRDLELPVGLEFIVYGSCWGDRLYCFPMMREPSRRVLRWVDELEATGVSEAVASALAATAESGGAGHTNVTGD